MNEGVDSNVISIDGTNITVFTNDISKARNYNLSLLGQLDGFYTNSNPTKVYFSVDIIDSCTLPSLKIESQGI